jgi:hypothetical protein
MMCMASSITLWKLVSDFARRLKLRVLMLTLSDWSNSRSGPRPADRDPALVFASTPQVTEPVTRPGNTFGG